MGCCEKFPEGKRQDASGSSTKVTRFGPILGPPSTEAIDRLFGYGTRDEVVETSLARVTKMFDFAAKGIWYCYKLDATSHHTRQRKFVSKLRSRRDRSLCYSYIRIKFSIFYSDC